MAEDAKGTETVVEVDTKALAEALRPAVGEMVKQSIDQNVDARRQEAQARQQAAALAKAQAEDPLRKVIDPYIRPEIERMQVISAAGVDYSQFYTDHPEARTHREAIEKRFNDRLAAGLPLSRNEIYNLYRGENFDKFADEREQAKKAEIDRLEREGATLTPGATRGGPATIEGDIWTMAPEDALKAIEKAVGSAAA